MTPETRRVGIKVKFQAVLTRQRMEANTDLHTMAAVFPKMCPCQPEEKSCVSDGKRDVSLYRKRMEKCFWGLHSLLSNGYQGLFPCELSGRSVKLTTHLRLVPRSRIRLH